MPVETQEVLIEFSADYSQLETGLDILAKTGAIDQQLANSFKQTTAEITKQGQALKTTTTEINKEKKSLDELGKSVQNVSREFIEGFQEGVIDTLKEAGVSVEEFTEALEDGNSVAEKSTVNLKKRLTELTQQLALLKAEGKDNTAQYKQLAQEAGRVQDSLSDVRQEIRGLGSDTQTIEGVIQTVQAFAGVAAIGQGAVALLGDDSKELQEVLVKVNATMAILQGLQSVQNILQKESAASLLLINVQRKIQNAQLTIENGLQSKNVVVKGLATAAQYALNLAMSLNPIGIVVTALAGLIVILANYAAGAREAARETAALNAALASSGENLNAEIDAFNDFTNRRVSDLKASGAEQSEILKLELKNEKDISVAKQRELQKLYDVRANLRNADEEQVRDLNSRINQLELDQTKSRTDIYVKENEIKQALRNEDTEAYKKAIEEQKKLEAELREARLSRLNDELAAIERRLLTVQQGSQEEIDMQKQVIAKKAQIDLEGEKITENQKQLIREKAFQEQLALQKKFNESSTQLALEGLIARNNAELQNISLTSGERLRIQSENIITQAQLEIDAAQGNAAKIKEITAKRDADIRELKRQTIESDLNYELELTKATQGEITRELQRSASNRDLDLNSRISAIERLRDMELAAINLRMAALNKMLSSGLISLKQYNLEYAKLIDEQTKVVEKSEKEKQDATKETTEKGKQDWKELFMTIVEVTSQVVGVLQSLYSLQSERENVRLQDQRARLQELREAGAISEKEFIARNKKLDQEEKKIKRQQAERDKQVAIFQAVINTAAAIAKALPNLVLASIAGAMGAAQIAIIASRPLPKFGTGKRSSYKGMAEIGETGQEMVQTDKGLYLAPKRTIVWLNQRDIVYNPRETRALLERSTHVVDKNVMKPISIKSGDRMDYDQLGKSIAKNISKIPQSYINIDENGFQAFIKEGNSRTAWMNKRYSSK